MSHIQLGIGTLMTIHRVLPFPASFSLGIQPEEEEILNLSIY